ncbi:hypothetical protein F5I97DRAFT_1853575 [Phlebopus sp. FC_14]|nr:hypothetical protein F5I97DRAFT_1853575 [Phlebopus sp. FC_14]
MTGLNEEREMTRNQRGLVDTCFEEGQYESGITMLDHLRSSAFKPPLAHVRQLLYIALFPPAPSEDRVNDREQLPPSPIKGSPSKQKQFLPKTSFLPSTAASEAAQRLLLSFASTNSPGSLLRALPSYPATTAGVSNPQPEASHDDLYDEDSVISRQSLCIKDCRSSWTILKEGFIQRKKLAKISQHGRKRRGKSVFDDDDDFLENGNNSTPAIVADHAWPVLEWLVSLFEKDESMNSKKISTRFSPLLLSQLPPPRSGLGPRWEVDSPLDIILHCINQEQSLRRTLGIRLLTLLINLSLSPDFDVNMFAGAVTIRLYSSSPQTIRTLISGLPKTTPVLTFKVALCQKYLSASPADSSGTNVRRKPQARPARRRSEATSANGRPGNAQNGSPAATKPALPSCEEIFRLVTGDGDSQRSPSSPVFYMKYELLLAYALLQREAPADQKDGDWQNALADGRLQHVVCAAFPSDGDDAVYQSILLTISSTWASG